MTTAIYDNHQEWHGQEVVRAFREYTQLPFTPVENGGGAENTERLIQAIGQAQKLISVSFNGDPIFRGHTAPVGVWSGVYNACKAAYNRGCTVVFGGGNYYGSPYIDRHGAGNNGAHPFSLDAGDAQWVNGRLEVSQFSAYNALLTEYYTDGITDSGAEGTSFAAPKLSAIVAEVQHMHGWKLSQMQLRSALTQACTFFEYKGLWLRYLDRSAFTATTNGVTNALRIQALYRVFLKRHPDAGGYAYWLGKLNSGLSIEEIAVPFKSAPEYRNGSPMKCPVIEVVQSWYHLWLGREADDGGAGWWAEQLMNTTDYVGLAREFIAGARANGERIDERLLF